MSFILLGVRGADLAKTFYFEENFFFGVILPPIVFSSGYNMHQSVFFRNFGNVSLFGLIVTLANFIVFGLATVAVIEWWGPE